MSNLEKEIRTWKKSLQKYGVFEDGQVADLELHLREAIRIHRQRGLTEEDVFQRAVAQVGTAESIAQEYKKNRLVLLNRRSPLRLARFSRKSFINSWIIASILVTIPRPSLGYECSPRRF